MQEIRDIQSRPDITFYVFGRQMPNNTASGQLQQIGWMAVDTNLPDLVPTTYEAAKSYIDQELLKLDDARDDVRREMCIQKYPMSRILH